MNTSAWHGFYNTPARRKRRAAQLAEEPLCRMCQAEGRITPGTIADQVIPHRGDPDADGEPLFYPW
jgi:hypothetical protein